MATDWLIPMLKGSEKYWLMGSVKRLGLKIYWRLGFVKQKGLLKLKPIYF